MIENYNIFEGLDGVTFNVLKKLIEELAYKDFNFNPNIHDYKSKIIEYQQPREFINIEEIRFCYQMHFNDGLSELEEKLERKISDWVDKLHNLDVWYIRYIDSITLIFGSYIDGDLYKTSLSSLHFPLPFTMEPSTSEFLDINRL